MRFALFALVGLSACSSSDRETSAAGGLALVNAKVYTVDDANPPADRFRRYWRVNSLENAGARLAFGSDFPATGLGVAGMHPLLNIETGHTRQVVFEATP